ncbi:endonuclease/exonuclease/phosphatase family protein [Nocardioides sp.]|uniref:endonuclease/exonuclease/phosphatase family protein n=1 Tax=Nocardioides sp. TaxID=35761 RepID=UPI002B6FC39E|nr:endonuclease/exonuclease/phosphatase family protein [Nocardioides sp.]HXH81110.1 endonuclease/exonuclease/phosphatase family protein [Nocardioides sp.]
MEEQHRTFLQQMVDRPANSAWIGVASPDCLIGKHPFKTYRRDGTVVTFLDKPISEVFVWKPEREGWAPELWVAPERSNYRPLYAKFLSVYWPGADINEVRNHIDHIFPKDPGALGGLSHVRLLAIPTRSNVSAGTLEKQMKARNKLLGPRDKLTRLATLYSLGKATGYVGYRELDTLEGRRTIAAGIMQSIRNAGASAEEITESGLDEELLVDRLSDLR